METAGEMGRDTDEAWTWTPLEGQLVDASQVRMEMLTWRFQAARG